MASLRSSALRFSSAFEGSSRELVNASGEAFASRRYMFAAETTALAAEKAAAVVASDTFGQRIALELASHVGELNSVALLVAFTLAVKRSVSSDVNASIVKLTSDMNASITKLTTSQDKLTSEMIVNQIKLSSDMHKLSSDVTVSQGKLASDVNASIDKLANDWNVRQDKLTSDMNKLSSDNNKFTIDMIKLTSDVTVSQAKLASDMKADLRETNEKLDAHVSKAHFWT